MHSSAPPVQLHGHHHPSPQGHQGYHQITSHNHQLGPLPQTTYDTNSGASTAIGNYSREFNHYTKEVSQTAQSGEQRNPGSIRWSSNGVSTTAERRLPFVHRFRPVNNTTTGNVLISPYHHQRQQHQLYQQQQIKQQEKRARNMAQYDSNPIGALQERFQSRGIIPDYKFLLTDGASHCPTFTFQVTVGDVTANGAGQTKKQSKQAAARAMLDILDGRNPGTPPDAKPITADGPTPETQSAKVGEQGSNGVAKEGSGPPVSNKIGMLQEYCVIKGLPMPVYEVNSVGGKPHQRVFTISAKVGCLTLHGDGTSKKEAKREAATKMYERLKGLGTGALPLINGMSAVKVEPGSYPTEDQGTVPVDEESISNSIKPLNQKQTKLIHQFYSDMAVTKAGALYNLHKKAVSSFGPNFVSFLDEIKKEQEFTVTYVSVDELTEDGLTQCLVQLSTMPVGVCNGFGANLEAAKNDSAKNALLYLKMMTQKNMLSNEAEKQPREANPNRIKKK